MKTRNIILIVMSVWLIEIAILIAILYFFTTHYFFNTKINGTDCSFLNIKQAQDKINKNISSKEICIKFANGVEYKIQGDNINLCLNDTKELEQILKSRKITDIIRKKEHTLKSNFSVNEEKFLNYLSSLNEFKGKKVLAQNASLNFDVSNHTVTIVPEKIGNIENIEKAFEIGKKCLTNGIFILDFTVTPEIISTSTELTNNKNKINNILNTTINYKLRNGKKITLNWDTWVKKNKNGTLNIEINNNMKRFLSLLNEKINNIDSTCTFPATGIGNIKLSLKKSLRTSLNQEAEAKRIKELLLTGKTHNIEPYYIENTYKSKLKNYIEVDLTRQKIWFYKNGKCIVNGSCVSGNTSQGHGTPTGMFFLTYKTTNTYLKGRNNDGTKYSSFVNYWMPFNGNIGLHDATWRSNFGGKIYKYNGSHGCINLPYSVAQKIYNNITYKTLIILYKS